MEEWANRLGHCIVLDRREHQLQNLSVLLFNIPLTKNVQNINNRDVFEHDNTTTITTTTTNNNNNNNDILSISTV